MNAARANFHHAKLPTPWWEDAVRDAAFEYKIIPHSTTGLPSYSQWHGRPLKICRLHTFGEIGTIPLLQPKQKLDPCYTPVRYMYVNENKTITVQEIDTRRYRTVRTTDFRPYSRNHDACHRTTRAFKAQAKPQIKHITTRSPRTHKEVRASPEFAQWAQAHGDELEELDQNKTIQWLPDKQIPPCERLIPLKMTYQYKRSQDSKISERKARFSARRDRMKPGVNYDRDGTTTNMAGKTCVRALIAISGAKQWAVEHFDITSAYLHEKYLPDRNVYIKQHPNVDGTYKKSCKAARLLKNIYGTPLPSLIYFDGLANHRKNTATGKQTPNRASSANRTHTVC